MIALFIIGNLWICFKEIQYGEHRYFSEWAVVAKEMPEGDKVDSERFRERVREITVRTRGRSIGQVVEELNGYIRGWWAYFSHCETRSCLVTLNAWVIRRLRAYIWEQWRLPRTRVRALINAGVPEYWAVQVGTTRKGPWRLSCNTTVAKALPVAYFIRELGLVLPG